MIEPTIYIDSGKVDDTGVLVPNWIQADLGKTTISIKDSIKKSKDVGKVFTAYTNPFNLPASKTNNKIFKRFSNNKVYEGFDPRRKYSAIIKLNGMDFKKGYIRLNKVSLQDNLPVNYSIQFFGELSSLKDILSDSKLKSLDYLSRFTFEYDRPNVHMGFEQGFDVINPNAGGRVHVTRLRIDTTPTSDGNLTVFNNTNGYIVPVTAEMSKREIIQLLVDHVNNNIVGYTARMFRILLSWRMEVTADAIGTDNGYWITGDYIGFTSTSTTTQIGGLGEELGDEFGIPTPNEKGQIIFPLISHTRGFEVTDDYGFHKMTTIAEQNEVPTSDWRLNIFDLKPALKVSEIFNAIEYQYPAISFDKDWLFGGDVGIKQVVSVAFSVGASSNGNITIGLNGTSHVIAIVIGDQDSVAAQVNTAVNLIDGYDSVIFGDNAVIIQAQYVGLQQDMTLVDTDSTGIVFSSSTQIAGADSGGVSTASPINDMYMWLHNKKGYTGYVNDDGDSLDFHWERILNIDGGTGSSVPQEWDLDAGYFDARPLVTYNNLAKWWTGEMRVENIAGDGDIDLKVTVYDRANEAPVSWLTPYTASFNASGGNVAMTFNFPLAEEGPEIPLDEITGRTYYLLCEIDCDSSIGEFRPELSITRYSYTAPLGDTTNYYKAGGAVPVIKNLNPQGLVPDYKIIEFLKDLFKMYNLVAFEELQDDNSYKINIKSYDHYINSGKVYDITKYVDISKSSVERVSPYSVISYEFSKPETFLAINQKEITGDSFGNIDFNVSKFSEGLDGNNSLLFDGGKYDVKVGLDKLMYERISKFPSGDLSDIQMGWYVNDNKENVPEPVLGKPLYLFPVLQDMPNGEVIKWSYNEESTTYFRGGNVNEDMSQTLHFNTEFDEWTRELNANSLFANYHDNYIAGIYSPYAKKIKLTARLTPILFTSIKLNDTIIVDNVTYFIEEMDLNILTGETKFTLLRTTQITTRLKGGNGPDVDNATLIWDEAENNWEDELFITE